MRSRLITLLLLAVVAFFLWRFAQKEDALLPPPADGGYVFPGLEMDAVTGVGVETRGGLEGGDWIEIKREPQGDWEIVFPAPEYAEQEIVDELLRTLAAIKVIPIERQGVKLDPADVGLTEPDVRRLRVMMGDREVELLLGKEDPLGKGDFARRGDSDEVLLISLGLRTFSEYLRPYDYVDKSIFRKYKAGVHGIRIATAERVWLDADRDARGWRVNEPMPGRGNASHLDALVLSLQYLDQRSVSETNPRLENLRNLGLPTPDERARDDLSRSTMIELRPQGEAPLRVFLMDGWRDSDPVWAIRDDGHKILALEPQGLSGIWTADTRSFLDPVLLPPLADRARHVSVQRGDELLLDIRRGPRGDWTFRAPERLAGVSVDSVPRDGRSSLSDFLLGLDSLRAEEFVPEPKADARLELRVGWDAGGRTVSEHLELLTGPDGAELARLSSRPGEGIVLAPHELDLEDPFLPDRLRSLIPVELSKNSWSTQQIQLPELDAPLELQRVVDHNGHATVTGDDSLGRRLGLGLDVLEGLRGLAWEPLPDDAPQYPWSLRWLDADGEELGLLRLRRPALNETQKVLGYRVVRAHWSGVPNAELVVADQLLQRFEELLNGG
ncbi:MAG: hypothetical protein DHS20C15_02430 [Planctomycetota bacterium]|nr:MAG: hypothetical protein DHS20C15_02430 [Planctomycetota bacterium]